MSQRLLDRQTLNSLISELTEISELAIAEGENAVADVARLRQQTEQLAAMSSAAVETYAAADEPSDAIANEPGPEFEAKQPEADTAAQQAQDRPIWLNFDEASETLQLEWPYTQDAADMSQRVHWAIERWLDEAQLKGALSQLANSGEAPQQWRCTLVKNKGRQRHLQIHCEYKKQRQLAAQAVIHTQ